jgi:hypothetical protein
VKKIAITVVVALALSLGMTGCNSQETKRVTREAHVLTAAFIDKMKKGETTREQEQQFIEAVGKVAYEVDRAVRGTKAADQTKNDINLITKGIDLSKPLQLDPKSGQD